MTLTIAAIIARRSHLRDGKATEFRSIKGAQSALSRPEGRTPCPAPPMKWQSVEHSNLMRRR
jgi:hypothetical protein